MLSIKEIIITAFILHMTFAAKITRDNLKTLKQWSFNNNTIAVPQDLSSEDESYTYVDCLETLNVSELNCNVTVNREKSDKTWNSKTCAVHVPFNYDKTSIVDLRLASMKSGIIIFSFFSYGEKTLDRKPELILISAKDCSNKQVKFESIMLPIFSYEVVPYDNTFDFVFQRRQSNELGKFFKVTYNNIGEKTSEVLEFLYNRVPYNVQTFNVYPINSKSSSNGLYFPFDFRDYLTLFVVNWNGKMKSSMNITFPYTTVGRTYTDIILSQEGNMFLICGKLAANKDSNGLCLSIDSTLNVKMNVTFDFKEAEQYLSVYALENKGFIILSFNPYVDDQKFTLNKVNLNGDREKLLEWKEIDCNENDKPWSQNVYRRRSDICFSTYCVAKDRGMKKWDAMCFDMRLIL